MTIEVLAYVVDGWRPLYTIDVKKFDKLEGYIKVPVDNTIPIDGYAEITNGLDFEAAGFNVHGEWIVDKMVHEVDVGNTLNRDFIIRAKRAKNKEWADMKYKLYRIDE